MSLLDSLTPTNTESESSLTQDDIAHLLRNDRRRQVIDHLATESGPHQRGDLASALAVRRYGSDYSTYERKREYISLQQKHLPPLADHDIIDYQEDRGIVTPGREFDVAYQLLTAMRDIVGA